MFVDEKLIYVNSKGESVVLGDSSIGLSSVEGLGDVSIDVQTKGSPYIDGVIYLDSYLEPRFIDLEVVIRGDSYEEVRSKRVEMVSKLNPKLGEGKLTYISGDIVREIPATLESIPFFPDKEGRGERWQRSRLSFICPNPYWLSPKIEEEPAFKPLFKFPFEGRFQLGLQRVDRDIYNDGDSELPVVIEFYGASEVPQIVNKTTGEFIRISKPLKEGETLIVNTENSSVLYKDDKTGVVENVFHWLDPSSTFFKLQLGSNNISCNCASSEKNKDFNLYYQKRYSTV